MPRPRRLSLPLALLLAQGCTSVIVVGDRDDAAVTPDQPVTLDLGDASDDGADGDAAEGPITDSGDCVDRDGDRYGLGLGCTNVDCDDTNSAVTDQCYCGRLPNTRAGCECRLGDPPRPCDVDSDLTYSETETCNVGQRTCEPVPGRPETAQWSACRAWRPDYPTPTRFVGVVSQCPGNCSTECRHQVVCPEAGDPIPAGSSNVVVANVAHAVFCPGGASIRGGITATCTSTAGGNYTRGTSPLSWRDACAAPGHQTALAGSDDGTTTGVLPFTFRFYGSPFNTVGIATNGMISFVEPTYVSANGTLPTGDVANTLFAFWDDVRNRANGVCTALFGSAPDREYVVQWNDQYFAGSSASGPEHLTYQVVLTETANTLDVLYNQMMGGTRAEGDSATVGIQQGTGSSVDLVGFNRPGVTPTGRTIRWTPAAGATVCSTGTYRRVYEGTTCNGSDAPYWGQLNFSSIVPPGTSIEFRVRESQTRVGLASAPWTRLANAPNGTPVVPTSVDVGAQIRAAMPTVSGTDRLPFLELQATLIPSPDGTSAPTLVSTEMQFTCAPPDESPCRAGVVCLLAADPCRRGRVACLRATDGRPVEVCFDDEAVPPGTVCGPGSVCNAAGACVPCPAGAGSVETCDNIDNDCDGRVDEDITMACYAGPAGTMGVGVCRAGRRACAAGAWGACAEEVRPGAEVCDALDNDCDGAVDEGVICP
ncbi:MAG: Tryptophan synthase alpha chain [Myxococcaceae bacterium]|nr:Tryptophan synthase alpha chain [Myxococcaceae bacterium]